MYEWRGGSTTVQELIKCRKTIDIKWASSDLRSCQFQKFTKFDKSPLMRSFCQRSYRTRRQGGEKWPMFLGFLINIPNANAVPGIQWPKNFPAFFNSVVLLLQTVTAERIGGRVVSLDSISCPLFLVPSTRIF